MRHRVKQAPFSTKGFTLVEVLTVILIIGILAAIAAPSWGGLAASRRASMAQDQILQKLRQAQAEATRTRTPQTVRFNTAVTPPTIQVISQTIPPVTRETIPLGEESTQRPTSPTMLGLQVSNSTGTPNNEVAFDDRGTVTRGVGMVITATSPANNGKRRCVIVGTLLGELRTEQDDQCSSS